MSFQRLTTESFDGLVKQWRAQCEVYGENFEEFAPERLAHARSIITEQSQDPRYGIYGLQNEAGFEALVHVNRTALPGSQGIWLRFIWVLLAPSVDFDDTTPQDIIRISSNLIKSALDLANKDKDVKHIKLHLGNFADKQLFAGI